VSQRLVPTADGNGRVACCEILVMTGRVHDMILDPKLTGQLPEVISEGAYYGMQTFDQHLLQHLHAGRVTMDDAMRVATSPHDFKLMVAASAKPADGPEATIDAPQEQRDESPPPEAPVTHEPPVHEQGAPPAPPMTVGLSDGQPSSPPPPSAPPPGVPYG
jgi:twitching motility protein PilT